MKFALLTILLLISLPIHGQQRTSAPYVLRLDADKVQHVRFNKFYPVYSPENPVTLDNEFAYEAWIKLSSTGTGGYLWSDGYGGAHALLWGFTGANGVFYMTGNVRSLQSPCSTSPPVENAANISFSSDEEFRADEWTHVAVALKGNVITLYKNGVPIGTQAFSGQRISGQCVGEDASAGTGYLGGSDHQNLSTRVAQFRVWEGASPLNGTSFKPDFIFGSTAVNPSNNQTIKASLLLDLTRAGAVIDDFSDGYKGSRHPGVRESALLPGMTSFPLPGWVLDATSPVQLDGSLPEHVTHVPAQPTPPAGAVIFDSFSRKDETKAFGVPSLGQTEAGNAVWHTPLPYSFGILNGMAVSLVPNYYPVAVVDTGSAEQEISIERKGNAPTGLAFRWEQDGNFLAATYNPANGIVSLLKFTGNGYVVLGSGQPSNPTWKTLRVTAEGNNLKVYVSMSSVLDGGQLSYEQVGPTITNSSYSAATKAGLFKDGTLGDWRADNFTVY